MRRKLEIDIKSATLISNSADVILHFKNESQAELFYRTLNRAYITIGRSDQLRNQ